MRLLDGYIGRSVLLTIVVVALIILGLDLLFAFINELDGLKGQYGAQQALQYVLLTAPRRFYDMLPLSALVGCLIGLGALASHSELTIMRAAGVSIRRIIWAVMKPLLVLMLCGGLVGEYLAPYTENMAESRRALAQGSGEAIKARGLWHREGNDFIHINAIQPNGVLHGVTRYRFNEQRHLLEASFARRATVLESGWVVEDVQTSVIEDMRTARVDEHVQQHWDVGLSTDLLRVVQLDPDVLPLSGLWHYQDYLQQQGLNNSLYRLAFWKKLLQPAATAALVFVAISFIFGPLRSVTLGQRVFTGVLVGFGFRILQDLLGPSSLVFGFSPLIAVLAPLLVLLVMGSWLLRRAG
ncbi:LPS export ABC transporter permease LptG [Halopseudomonas yangmingensis]|uniref:Lipopolysaccharide export system permease protein n=1 Tax=Halopseudomonas yangmingensis TaxID=1720063 RepID=A0A1I4RCY2_9GAMM|nr:LPS export ABC transporter permease LptG [Halopseudomonas yangmingensis]SFM50121.1 lipopolysaccharide export system permease protein [Halopseudomonas yangmingensis]